MYLAVWSNAVWELDGDGKPALATIDEIYAACRGQLPQIWELHACFRTGRDRDPAHATRRALERQLEELRENKRRGARASRSARDADDFYDSLPRVRRALANVPTYMVFDDHDVTDDWNIGRAWRDQVYTSPLGRRIITNALVAYALFQDWGNDPLRYRGQGPFRDLLDHALEYQPLDRARPGRHDAGAVGAEKRSRSCFGLNQPDPETPRAAAEVALHLRRPASRGRAG